MTDGRSLSDRAEMLPWWPKEPAMGLADELRDCACSGVRLECLRTTVSLHNTAASKQYVQQLVPAHAGHTISAPTFNLCMSGETAVRHTLVSWPHVQQWIQQIPTGGCLIKFASGAVSVQGDTKGDTTACVRTYIHKYVHKQVSK